MKSRCDHASHRNTLRRTQARIRWWSRRPISKRKVDDAARRAQGPRADQRLPARQGAGRASQAPVRPLGHGRDDRGHRARGQRQDRDRARLSSSRWSRRSSCPTEEAAIEERDRGQGRPRLHGRDRDPAADRARRFQGHQARPADRRGDRRRDRRGAQRIAEQNRPFVAKAEGARRRTATGSRSSFTGTIDGEPFEGGTGEDIASSSAPAPSFPASRSSSIGIKAGENTHHQGHVPDELSERRSRRQGSRVRGHAKSVEAPGEVTIDDEFAKTLGLELLAKLQATR